MDTNKIAVNILNKYAQKSREISYYTGTDSTKDAPKQPYSGNSTEAAKPKQQNKQQPKKRTFGEAAKNFDSKNSGFSDINAAVKARKAASGDKNSDAYKKAQGAINAAYGIGSNSGNSATPKEPAATSVATGAGATGAGDTGVGATGAGATGVGATGAGATGAAATNVPSDYKPSAAASQLGGKFFGGGNRTMGNSLSKIPSSPYSNAQQPAGPGTAGMLDGGMAQNNAANELAALKGNAQQPAGPGTAGMLDGGMAQNNAAKELAPFNVNRKANQDVNTSKPGIDKDYKAGAEFTRKAETALLNAPGKMGNAIVNANNKVQAWGDRTQPKLEKGIANLGKGIVNAGQFLGGATAEAAIGTRRLFGRGIGGILGGVGKGFTAASNLLKGKSQPMGTGAGTTPTAGAGTTPIGTTTPPNSKAQSTFQKNRSVAKETALKGVKNSKENQESNTPAEVVWDNNNPGSL